MSQTLTLQQAAERLKVRPKTIREFVAKKRLSFVGEGLLDTSEVEKLALLMDKLRADGIATLVNISSKDV